MKNSNKLVLVTGGSRGLGKNMALALAAKGNDVIITYKSKEEEAVAVLVQIEALGTKALALQLDLADSNSINTFISILSKALPEKFNVRRIDYLVNNAGVGLFSPFVNTSEEQLDLMIAIQFKAPFLFTQKVLPLIKDGGGILNVSTGLTRFTNPGFAAYAAMKGAMEVLTKYQAKELGDRRIRVNIIAPGAFETDFGGGVVRDNASMNKIIASNTALARVGLPHDIGGVVAFLCSDDAYWINGERLEISGGQQL